MERAQESPRPEAGAGAAGAPGGTGAWSEGGGGRRGPGEGPAGPVPPRGRRWIVLALLVLVGLGLARVRSRLLDVPLERDEGEYAYIAQLLLRGEPPYGAAYNMKLPGIYLAYAASLAAFGESQRGVHLGLLVASLATLGGLFLLARRLCGPWGALAACLAFAVLSVGAGVQGPFANAEHFVLVPAVLGLWLLARALRHGEGEEGAAPPPPRLGSLAGAGLLLGLAFVVKQHGGAFGLFGALWLALAELRGLRSGASRPGPSLRRLALFLLALATPYALVCLWLWLAGVFANFWFWTVTYAREYTGVRPWSEFARNLRGKGRFVTAAAPFLWWLAAFGLTALAWDRRGRRAALPLALLAVCSFLAVVPGFLFRPHYFVLTLPAVSLAIGVGTVALHRLLRRRLPAVAAVLLAAAPVALAGGHSLWKQRRYLFGGLPHQVSRWTFPGNPFPESLAVANFVREATGPDDRVAILGSEPQILFYSGRRGASGYVYVYALMEPQPFAARMQEDMIAQLEESRAKILVLVKVGSSWLATEKSCDTIQRWIPQELRHYELVAYVPVGQGSALVRDPEPGAPRPEKDVVEIYRRRP